jgi:nucleotide-binding universal stress UspA family protein
MAEKILIPMDGSTLGETALHYVEELISKLKPKEKPELILLHIVNLEPYLISTSFSIEPFSSKDIELAKRAALTYLQNIATTLRDKGFEVDYKVMQGKVVEEIIKAEKELDADLIAISTHGHSGFTRLAFGSVAEKIMHAGTLPVLVVRAEKGLLAT